MYSGRIQLGRTVIDMLLGGTLTASALVGYQLHRELEDLERNREEAKIYLPSSL